MIIEQARKKLPMVTDTIPGFLEFYYESDRYMGRLLL